MPAAVQRSTICPLRQRVTLRLVVRVMEIIDSTGFDKAGPTQLDGPTATAASKGSDAAIRHKRLAADLFACWVPGGRVRLVAGVLTGDDAFDETELEPF